MAPKWTLEAVDVRLKDIMQKNLPSGVKSMILGGDFLQVLPAVQRRQREDVENALWRHCVTFHLSTNMRASAENIERARMLLQIGNGTYTEDVDGLIELPAEIRSSGDLITEIFGKRISINDVGNLAEKAILAPKNIYVAHQRMREELDLKIYKSVSGSGDILNYPAEFLSQLSPAGMPPHELRQLKRLTLR